MDRVVSPAEDDISCYAWSPARQVRILAWSVAAILALGTAVWVGSHVLKKDQGAAAPEAAAADKATQVFSPYSGRVIKVLVGLGEAVRRGEPLIATS